MRDIRGRRRSVTDPDGNTATYDYDGLDHPIRITRPEITKYAMPAGSMSHETFEYDPEGLLMSGTDRMSLKKVYTRTSRHQVETITRDIGGTRTFGYDANGNLTSGSDWKGNATTHDYDALNRRVSTTNRLGHAMFTDHDGNDNVTSVTDYEGNETTHAYDALNRRTETVHPEPDGGTLTYTYYNESDPETNLHTDTDPEGTVVGPQQLIDIKRIVCLFWFQKGPISLFSGSKRAIWKKLKNPIMLFLMPKRATQALKTPVSGPVSLIF